MTLTQTDLAELGNTAFPLYYRLMVFHQIPVGERGKYLAPIVRPEIDLKGLEGLVNKAGFKERIETEERLGTLSKSQCLNLLMQVSDKDYYEYAAGIDDGLEGLRSVVGTGVSLVVQNLHNSSPDVLQFLNGESRRAIQIMNQVLGSETSGFRRGLEIVKARFQKFRGQLPADIVEKQLYACSFGFEKLYSAFLRIKADRARALDKIDVNLSKVYLGFSPVTIGNITIITDPQFANAPAFVSIITQELFIDYLRQDQKLYEDIVGIFRAKNEENHYTKPRKIVNNGSDKTAEDIRRRNLRESIVPKYLQLGRDSQTRISYFVDDILGGGYSGARLDGLMEAFSDFNLGKRMRKREDRPSDIQFRNFLDDVTLEYVRKGAVPAKTDLEGLYQRECSKSKDFK